MRYPEVQKLTQEDLLEFVHGNDKFDEFFGCNVYGIALAYIKELELENEKLKLRLDLIKAFQKLEVIK